MKLFSLAKPFIHSLDPEKAHELAIKALKNNLVPHDTPFNDNRLTQNMWNITFPHPVGLAAGFDKNGEVITPLFEQGFSFVEAGTVTPKPQEGNPKPRLFRLKEDNAVINRMGFNNYGKEKFIKNLNTIKQYSDKKGIIGANIGKNKTSPNDASDYLDMLTNIYGLSDYITINISSPNTPNLRELQSGNHLDELLQNLHEKKCDLLTETSLDIPLLLKIAPDIDNTQAEHIASSVKKYKFDGIIIGNTTLDRNNIRSRHKNEDGGLSGQPLFNKSTKLLKHIHILTEGKIPLIGVGGISNGRDAYIKIRNGASLIQLYTVLIYKGFHVINEINKELIELLEKDGFTSINEAIGVDAF